ncbi:hypothetical protein GA707_02635 [Nostocoides sp. F2B08]|uniref:hypothetical protein n=1 Tax=Nostocoides sp. F2B08 TaxID=2653936 RepID=UPI001263BE27|nr:hypothetical protein [Tetrasphaera sp. F2B08]KAB7746413.1 hypothetical protein GA707_02635 [Tetrasphaera sp. F2B08]
MPSSLAEPSADELRSIAEQVMGIALEHVLMAGSAGTSVGRASPTRSTGAITIEEIDDLARQVRRGEFETIDEAVEARDEEPRLARAENCDDPAGHRSRRVDFRFVRIDDDGGHDLVFDPEVQPACSSVDRAAVASAEPPPF